MSGLILPARFTRQPQAGAKLDRAHPLLLGMTPQIVFVGGASAEVSAKKPLITKGTITSGVTLHGKTLNNGNGVGDVGVLDGIVNTNACVDFWVGEFTNIATSFQYLYGDYNANGIGLAAAHASIAGRCGWYDGTVVNDSGITLANGQHIFVVVREVNGGVHRIYRDDKLLITGANAGATGGKLAFGSLGQNQWTSSTSGSGSKTALFGRLYGRGWSAREVANFSRNVWQIFKAPTRRLWIGASAATSYTLTADSGSYTLTGQAATLKAARLLTAAQGSYSFTGQAAILKAARLIAAGQGSYTLSGQAAILKAARLIAAGQGSYTLTSQAAILKAARLIAAAQGSYTLNGRDASLIYSGSGNKTISAGQGSYALTGQAATLKATRKLAAAQGSYSLNGQSAALSYSGAVASYTLTAGLGSFTLTGFDALFTVIVPVFETTPRFSSTRRVGAARLGYATDTLSTPRLGHKIDAVPTRRLGARTK